MKHDNKSNTLYLVWYSVYYDESLRSLKKSFNLEKQNKTKLKQNDQSHIPQEWLSSATLLEAQYIVVLGHTSRVQIPPSPQNHPVTGQVTYPQL